MRSQAGAWERDNSIKIVLVEKPFLVVIRLGVITRFGAYGTGFYPPE